MTFYQSVMEGQATIVWTGAANLKKLNESYTGQYKEIKFKLKTF